MRSIPVPSVLKPQRPLSDAELLELVRWDRFWAPVDGELDLSDDGYLPDVKFHGKRMYNAGVVPLDELASSACLVLLGEPGTGKSQAVRVAAGRAVGPDEAGHFNLKSCSTDVGLLAEVFNHPKLAAWAAGNTRLTLWLDSFDECLVPGLPGVLSHQLSKLPRDRLHLRIVSRPGAWPDHLQRVLKELWPTAAVFKIAPLRRSDVRAYADAATDDGNGFMDAVRIRRAQPLARHPFRLKLLAREFRERRHLPETSDLYQNAVKAMAGEISSERAEETQGLSRAQRTRIVERIAATTLLGQKPFIVRSADVPPASNAIAQDLLAGGYEEIDDEPFAVTPEGIASALSTSFFTTGGDGPLSFEGQAFAELLAGNYLHARRVPLDQAMLLLVDQGRGRVVPQLQEVALRLAQLDQAFAARLLDIDCLLLLRAAPRGWSDERRAAALDLVLKELADGRQVDSREVSTMTFEWCAHPALADQLRPWILNKSVRLSARRVAMQIAEERHVLALGPAFVELALDDEAAYHLRERAVVALDAVGSADERARLRGLLGTPRGLDRLAYLAIEVMWPDVFTPKELFELLPVSGTTFRSFGYFLREEVDVRLDDEALLHGLRWARGATRPQTEVAAQVLFNKLAKLALVRAPANIEIAVALVEVVGVRLRLHQGALFRRPTEDPEDDRFFLDTTRRRMLVELIARHAGESRSKFNLAHRGLVGPDDFEWLLERIRSATSADARAGFIVTLNELCWASQITDDNAKLGLLRDLVGDVAGAAHVISIDSLVAERERIAREIAKAQSVEAQQARIPSTPWPRKQRLTEALEVARRGDASGWGILHWMLVADLEGNLNPYDPNLVARDTWAELAKAERQTAIAGAERFLRDRTADSAAWDEHDMLHAYAAFCLLHDAALETYSALPGAVWSVWTPAIIARGAKGPSGEPYHAMLLAAAKQADPATFIEAITSRVRSAQSPGADLYFMRDLSTVWDLPLTAAVLAELDGVPTTVGALGDVLNELLAADAPGAFDYAIALTKREPERAELAFVALLRHRGPESWEVVWPRLVAEPALGDRVLNEIGQWRGTRAIQRLFDRQLADLYIWVAARHGQATDLDTDAAVANSLAGRLSRLIRDVMFELRARGTESSFGAVKAIQSASSEPRRHDWDVADAERQWVRARWTPLAPEYLRSWFQDPERRVVRSGADLIDLVEHELLSIRKTLLGTSVEMLWDVLTVDGKPRRRPKKELVFRDFLIRELRHRLVRRRLVINREVEVERKGRLDVYIQALPRDAKVPAFEVVVELKRSGNRELLTGMKKQLRDGYLVEGVARHGLYVIAWYEDRTSAKPSTFEAAEAYFAEQAASLSDPVRSLRACVFDLRIDRTRSIRADDKEGAAPRKSAKKGKNKGGVITTSARNSKIKPPKKKAKR